MNEPAKWVLPMTPDMLRDLEEGDRLLPTPAEVDAFIAAFDKLVLPSEDAE